MTLPAAVPGQLAELAGPSCYSRLTNHWICGQYLSDYHAEIQTATVQHLQITVYSVVLGLVLAFPLAVLARSVPVLEQTILALATGVYTIPSLALFPLLVPFTGLTRTTVVIGLALYCLTILVRAFLEGLRTVPDDVVESARGLGYGAPRLLFRVQLPLALPVVMAGLRVATVSTVALTTVGSLVAAGGLGQLIKDGATNDFKAELLTAAVLCVVIAIVLDVVIVGVQWLLTPWSHSRSNSRSHSRSPGQRPRRAGAGV